MNKEQWDYVGNFSIGDCEIAHLRDKVARWINPFNGEIKEQIVENNSEERKAYEAGK